MKVLYVIEAETGHDGDIGKSEAGDLAAHLSRYQTWRDCGVRVWTVSVYEADSKQTKGWELKHQVQQHLGGYRGQDPATFSHRGRRKQPQEPADTNDSEDAK